MIFIRFLADMFPGRAARAEGRKTDDNARLLVNELALFVFLNASRWRHDEGLVVLMADQLGHIAPG